MTEKNIHCGLCDEFVDDWEKHEKSDTHKKKLLGRDRDIVTIMQSTEPDIVELNRDRK